MAVILAGAARSFAQPLLYRTIRTNLLEAFAGNITLIPVLTLEDRRGDPTPCCSATIVATREAYDAAPGHLAGAAVNGVHATKADRPLAPICGEGRGFHLSLLGQVMTHHS